MRVTASARRVWLRVLVALAIGIAWPYLELAWNCRAGFADSEACVWGKAYLPLGRWLEPLIVAPLVFTALTLAAWLWGTRRQGFDESSSGRPL